MFFIGFVLPSDYYLIVVRVDLFHRGFRFAGVLGTLKLQYPNRTFGHEDHDQRHVDDGEHDERTVDDVQIEVRQSRGDQNAARKENAVQRQQELLAGRMADFRHVHDTDRRHA